MESEVSKPWPRLILQPWLHLLIIAALIISRRPDAVFHPLFWAEDGQVFYHDAYTRGWPALLHPLGGYLNTFSRLAAAVAIKFPLSWAPALYAVFAFAVQLIPPALLLSPRLETALPSFTACLALAYFYAAQPNSYELNVCLTNAQWHLAIAAFLLMVARPGVSPAARWLDCLLLLISGLSGPFGIFLAPLAWFEHWQRRERATLINAAIISGAALIQISLILASHATSGRLVTPLGATPSGFLKIMCYQIVLGGLLGYRLTVLVLTLPFWRHLISLVLLFAFATVLVLVAWRRGPAIYRKFLTWAAMLFGAALITPLSSTTISQWTEMTHPGASVRYYVMPTIAWFAAILILARSPWLATRCTAYLLIAITLFGIRFDWLYPPFHHSDFYALAAHYATAPAGTVAVFPEDPPGWQMTLIKH